MRSWSERSWQQTSQQALLKALCRYALLDTQVNALCELSFSLAAKTHWFGSQNRRKQIAGSDVSNIMPGVVTAALAGFLLEHEDTCHAERKTAGLNESESARL